MEFWLSHRFQPLGSVGVEGEAVRLAHHAVRRNAEPREIGLDRRRELRLRALEIGVVEAQHEGAARTARSGARCGRCRCAGARWARARSGRQGPWRRCSLLPGRCNEYGAHVEATRREAQANRQRAERGRRVELHRWGGRPPCSGLHQSGRCGNEGLAYGVDRERDDLAYSGCCSTLGVLDRLDE